MYIKLRLYLINRIYLLRCGDRVNNPYRWSIATCNSYEVLLSLTLFYMILLYLSLLTSHEQHFFNGLNGLYLLSHYNDLHTLPINPEIIVFFVRHLTMEF